MSDHTASIVVGILQYCEDKEFSSYEEFRKALSKFLKVTICDIDNA